MVTDWQAAAEEAMKNALLEQNDRLVAELIGFMPIPEVFISEWMPGDKLILAIENPYIAKKDKLKLLERLGRSAIIEDRLYAATFADTPISTLELLAGDTELPIRIAVANHQNSPRDLIEIIESQEKIASSWDTKPEDLAELAETKWSWIRQTVARNPYTPQDVLAKLAIDEVEKVQLAVARNYGASGEVLDLLTNHY